jgi:predicted RNA-binding protein
MLIILINRANIHIIKKELYYADASKNVVLEVNVEKSNYMLMSRHQTTGQNMI